MSEKKAEKLMYAIGGVSEEMLKETEKYSESIKNGTFRKKRIKKYAKTIFAIGTAAAVIGCSFLVYEKPKQPYGQDSGSTGQTIDKKSDKSMADGSADEKEKLADIPENINIFNPEITKENIQDSDGIKSSVSQDTVSGYDEAVSGTQKNKKSETNDGVSADYDETEVENSSSAGHKDNSDYAIEIKADKKQRLKVYTKKNGRTREILFILQFGKIEDGGTYTCGVKAAKVNMSIEKTASPGKDNEWKENKKAKVVCKSGTKLIFTAHMTKKQQAEKNIKLSEINVKFKEKGDKSTQTSDGFNMIVRKEKDRYYLCMKK